MADDIFGTAWDLFVHGRAGNHVMYKGSKEVMQILRNHFLHLKVAVRVGFPPFLFLIAEKIDLHKVTWVTYMFLKFR